MSQAEDPTGEIVPVWWCTLSGRGGDREYLNGPFLSERAAVEFGSTSGRRFYTRKEWFPVAIGLYMVSRPRLWDRHPRWRTTRRSPSLES